MLSPVAVSLDDRQVDDGDTASARSRGCARWLGWDNPAFFVRPWIARALDQAMDAWTSIPFMMILLLAGLQALPKEVMEAARVDGATAWQTFWQVTFPLMLPVSVTAIILRIIFKLKLADIVINVTSGGPGGATDTVTSFIYREYRDRSNVGYGTHAGDGLSRHHHRVHHAAAEARRPQAHAEDDLMAMTRCRAPPNTAAARCRSPADRHRRPRA